MAISSQYLNPLSQQEPCGPFKDPVGLLDALLRAPIGQDQDAFVPNWSAIASKCEEEMRKSYHLHTALTYSLAMLGSGGLAGYADGLRLLNDWLDTFWDSVHPTLDPAGGTLKEKAFERLSILGYMRRRTYPEPYDVLYWLERAPIIRSQAVGDFSLLSIEKAMDKDGKIPWPEDPVQPTSEMLIAALKDVQQRDPELIAMTAGAMVEISDLLKKLSDAVKNRAGESDGFEAASAIIAKMHAGYRRLCLESGVAVPEASLAEATAGSQAAGASFMAGEIRSRAEVSKAIQAIAAYYAKNEPTSPVPILLSRAERWSQMNFLQILEDLALPSDAIAQVTSITGSAEQPPAPSKK